MHKFKLGDKVKYTSGNHGDGMTNPLWDGQYGRVVGTIINTATGLSLPIRVQWPWPNGPNVYEERDLEHTMPVYTLPEELFEL